MAIPKVNPPSIKPKLAGLSFSKSKDIPPPSPADNAMDVESPNSARNVPSASIAASTVPRKSNEAESFLNSLGLGTDKVTSTAAPAARIDPLKRIPKKWKWTGDLFVDQPDGTATKLCQVSLSEVVDAGTGNHFSVLLSGVDSLRIRNLLGTKDMIPMIRGCKECQQVVKLENVEASEGRNVTNLSKSMAKDSKVALIPMDLNDAQVGIAVIFSSLSLDICNKFKVPSSHRTTPIILIGYLPYLMTSSKLSNNDASMSFDSLLEAAATSVVPNVGMKGFIHQPMTVLGFPAMLRKHLTAQRGKPFTIWTRGPGQGSSQIDVEVRQLQRALRKCQWTYVAPEAEARLVFVHLPALSAIGKFPQLADRKGKHPEIHFYTFGSDPAITMDRWGVKPIYTIGGIMTFTPRALAENPFDCLNLMMQCKEHPFWDSYILSWVLGAAARKAPTLSLAFIKPFLELALEGDITLLHTDRESPGVDFADLLPSMKDENQVMEDCLRSASELFTDPSKLQASDAENELSRSLTWLHVQPALLEYRRFVVIRAEAESHISAGKDGFEWCSPSQFEFGDCYFDKMKLS
ncbi:hypothetical protein CONPUDRAFT_133856 [Coniophora puteana RWD-64-598 SS2]|uniref:Uncharacterized protein n=1 Tax=Coniophora puteana (strain RWD-64-598) TaxID=741705 RepID=A0A5M3N6C4_CONPW|nr:uncharacterized protein CONPUDRAFT_133856 [Coniophora puteana RWD-64-598 SS2]EIW86421.1 hypothetical protein CONPUDRAFT_133856 [Coniophora puteana RWD-64-598 SS2]